MACAAMDIQVFGLLPSTHVQTVILLVSVFASIDIKMTKSDCQLYQPDVDEMPHQPVCHCLSNACFGKKKMGSCTFQGSLFDKLQQVQHNFPRDHEAFCYMCVSAIKTGKNIDTSINVQDSAFLSGGFRDCKDATRCLGDSSNE